MINSSASFEKHTKHVLEDWLHDFIGFGITAEVFFVQEQQSPVIQLKLAFVALLMHPAIIPSVFRAT